MFFTRDIIHNMTHILSSSVIIIIYKWLLRVNLTFNLFLLGSGSGVCLKWISNNENPTTVTWFIFFKNGIFLFWKRENYNFLKFWNFLKFDSNVTFGWEIMEHHYGIQKNQKTEKQYILKEKSLRPLVALERAI